MIAEAKAGVGLEPCGGCAGCRVIAAARELVAALDALRHEAPAGAFEGAAKSLALGLGPDGVANVRRLLAAQEELDS